MQLIAAHAQEQMFLRAEKSIMQEFQNAHKVSNFLFSGFTCEV